MILKKKRGCRRPREFDITPEGKVVPCAVNDEFAIIEELIRRVPDLINEIVNTHPFKANDWYGSTNWIDNI